jgi:hypothetical protein
MLLAPGPVYLRSSLANNEKRRVPMNAAARAVLEGVEAGGIEPRTLGHRGRRK